MNVAAIAPSQNPQLVPLQNESKSLWLFSLPVDVGLLLVPLLVATPLGLYALLSNDNSGYQTFNYWAWIAQFIFGNTTHVILTFFLLGAKTDVLTATKGQAPLVIVGSSITFLAAVGFFYLCKVIIPEFSDLAVAVGLTFSLHHSLSQTKGLWSLYNLRALEQKVPIAPNERTALQYYVPLGLSLCAIRTFFVAKDTRPDAPAFVNVLVGEPAVLPHVMIYVFLAIWALYSLYCLYTLRGNGTFNNIPKTSYIATNLVLVGLVILAPAWGVATKGAVHGLEYYFLCAQMLKPTQGEQSRLSPRLVWPFLFASLSPILFVGLLNSPFALGLNKLLSEPTVGLLLIVTNGVVMAHYFADAFIYRFRIPEVRKVALTRLGFIRLSDVQTTNP